MTKTCKQCNTKFEITDGDLGFYKKISPTFDGKTFEIPAPTLCPQCRYQRRISWRNERNLYKRKCDATGKEMISIFSPDKKSPPVYSAEAWWSDSWNAKDFGRDFDFSRPFFEQFHELFKVVPQLTLNNQKSENSEYTNQSQMNKNCYMMICGSYNEGCMYGMWYQNCKDSIDCQYLEKSELCYEVLNAKNCYSCKWSQTIEDCTDCYFCASCIDCKNCFGCVSLHNKEYYFYNEKLSRDEYFQRLGSLDLGKRSSIEKTKKEFVDFRAKMPQKFYRGKQNENSTGDYLVGNKNARNCFNARDNENINDSQDAWRARNCCDLTETLENDFCMELEGCGWGTNQVLCSKIVETSNVYYSSHIYYSSDIFGCVGLRNSKYCILNKQYSKEEYEKLAGKIIEHMQETGEWGEWFPIKYSPFGYNESVAMDYFPLNKEGAAELGAKWQDNNFDIEYSGPFYEPHDNIEEYAKSEEEVEKLLDGILKCETSGRPFKIVPQELSFYIQNKIPIPTRNFHTRFTERFALRNPRILWHRKCMNEGCENEFETTYAPDRPEKVYCEGCYQKSII